MPDIFYRILHTLPIVSKTSKNGAFPIPHPEPNCFLLSLLSPSSPCFPKKREHKKSTRRLHKRVLIEKNGNHAILDYLIRRVKNQFGTESLLNYADTYCI